MIIDFWCILSGLTLRSTLLWDLTIIIVANIQIIGGFIFYKKNTSAVICFGLTIAQGLGESASNITH